MREAMHAQEERAKNPAMAQAMESLSERATSALVSSASASASSASTSAASAASVLLTNLLDSAVSPLADMMDAVGVHSLSGGVLGV
jgi:hypothetical protein